MKGFYVLCLTVMVASEVEKCPIKYIFVEMDDGEGIGMLHALG